MLVSNSEIRDKLVEQTADLRFSVASEGLRNLLVERGYNPIKSIQLACDQGDDVSVVLVLDDATAVRLDYREHFRTRQAIQITEWEEIPEIRRRTTIARSIAIGNDAQFDNDVRNYFDRNLAATDTTLPPLNWGDRIWHAFEDPPE